MAALLLMLAMLWSNLADIVGMLLILLSRACHTDVAPDRLPLQDREPTAKETKPAAASSRQTTVALMVSRCASAHRPSNHEGGLTAACNKPVETHQDCLNLPPLIPAEVGTQRRQQGWSRLEAASAHSREDRLDLPRTRARSSGHIAPA
jgi:hypothetical protein